MQSSKWAAPPGIHTVSLFTIYTRPSYANPRVKTVTAANTAPLPSAPPNNASVGLSMPDDSSYDLDEFAQTRPPDDLFGDEYTPISEPVVKKPAQRIPKGPSNPRAGRGGRGRGGRKDGNLEGRVDSPQKPTPEIQETTTEVQKTQDGPDGPRKEAVRGDRSGTGGVKKAKLTEEELSARMEAVKLKNAALEAAHARAEADEASFQAREAEAHQRRRVERQNRQQMMGEREKNRMRKLNAVSGREWDATKDPDEATNNGHSGQSQFRRGAFGGVVGGLDGSQDQGRESPRDLNQDRGEFQIRGRGRGRGGPRGRGREGTDSGRPQAAQKQPVPAAEDFPALAKTKDPPVSSTTASGTTPPDATTTSKPTAITRPEEMVSGTKVDWADEMNSPVTRSAK